MGHFLSASPTKKFFGVVHLSMTPAVCNFLPQIWQPNIGILFARGGQRYRPQIGSCYFWLLSAANDVAIGIGFVGV